MAAFCDMRFGQAGVIGKRRIMAAKWGEIWEESGWNPVVWPSHISPDSKRTMRAHEPGHL
ncbi:hypothetical protein J2W33_004645 [Variovorax boronicumulans]|uniref:Uncharacterized protein n=1 Tax=Variovorax paradoxus (strain EPS) TaxID=595537 RepID=E6V110_VARPE|nr:hypothetical protein Varpa_4872 [Variovorax paradoxus EPS]MDQ0043735.1 hypothetical protein [Variovorax boronicumulans]